MNSNEFNTVQTSVVVECGSSKVSDGNKVLLKELMKTTSRLVWVEGLLLIRVLCWQIYWSVISIQCVFILFYLRIVSVWHGAASKQAHLMIPLLQLLCHILKMYHRFNLKIFIKSENRLQEYKLMTRAYYATRHLIYGVEVMISKKLSSLHCMRSRWITYNGNCIKYGPSLK